MVGCIAAGAFVCYMAPEYGYSPMYFFAACFYALTGAVRFVLRWRSDRALTSS
jgi:hypothetical protein